MVGCYALMLELNNSFEHPWDVAHISGSDLSWISINSTKPDRVSTPCVVALSTNRWAEEKHGVRVGPSEIAFSESAAIVS